MLMFVYFRDYLFYSFEIYNLISQEILTDISLWKSISVNHTFICSGHCTGFHNSPGLPCSILSCIPLIQLVLEHCQSYAHLQRPFQHCRVELCSESLFVFMM